FFVLGRRRLTIWTRDWSSDVCSSDLNVQSKGDAALTVTNVQIVGANAGSFAVVNQCAGQSVAPGDSCGLVVRFTPTVLGTNTARSEERRVGKEWRVGGRRERIESATE